MADITPAQIAKLREMTSAGMMDCKRALQETNGDLDAAVDVLRKRGRATAAKKALREAREGIIAQHICPAPRTGVLVEVNCETDFAAKNESFRAFCDLAARTLATDPAADLEPARLDLVAKTRENVRIARHQRFDVSGNAIVASYIHTGAKIGVLVEVGAGKADTLEQDDFKQLVRDLTLQIAAANPIAVSRSQVDPAVVAKEKDIAADSDLVKHKPPKAVGKIIEGKIEKFFQTACLLEQGFVKKNSEVSVREHIAGVEKQLADEVTVRRFVRFQLGESFGGAVSSGSAR
jgi:elongation factor Ts